MYVMLCYCEILGGYRLKDGSSEFIISIPVGLSPGSCIIYQGSQYYIKFITYNDDTGVLTYKVTFSGNRGDLQDNEDPKSFAYREYFLTGQKLQAIKYLKESIGMSLSEAKAEVDSWT